MMKRESNTELLRTLAIIGVMTLHYTTVVTEQVASCGAADRALSDFMRAISIPAVNVFVLITSFYLAANNNRDLRKPLLFYIKVVLYSFGLYLVTSIPAGTFSAGSAIWRLIPGNWFLPLYIALYLISPFINVALQNLTKESGQRMLVIFVLLFSVVPTVVDILKTVTGSAFGGWEVITNIGSASGYSIVQFVLMYVLGAYLRLHPPQIQRSRILLLLALNIACIFAWMLLGGLYVPDIGRAINSYCHPLVVSCALLYFLLFRTFRFESGFVNLLGRASVSMFLLSGWTTSMTSQYIPSLGLLLPWLLSVVVEYAVSIVVELIYGGITKGLFRKPRILKVEQGARTDPACTESEAVVK